MHLIPIDCGFEVQELVSIEETSGPAAPTELSREQQMAELIGRIEEMCRTNPCDV